MSRSQNLKIVLSKGHTVSGTLLDENGRPSAGEIVKIVFVSGKVEKIVATDVRGRFLFTGLASQKLVTLHTCNVKRRVNARRQLALDRDQTQVDLQLQPWRLKHEPKIVTVLGMQVADIDDELRDACELGAQTTGVLIFDPRNPAVQSDIGELATGDYLWAVEGARVATVRELVERILAETAEQEGRPGEVLSVGLTYAFRRPGFLGATGLYLTITADEVKTLRKLLDSWGAIAARPNTSLAMPVAASTARSSSRCGPRWSTCRRRARRCR